MNFLKVLLLTTYLFFLPNSSFSQCFEIESILVDACNNGTGSSADEGLNEMFRIKIGAAPLNTTNLSVDWPAQSWLGLIQNATTASKVAQLNANIAAAGGCGQILEPTGGILPANATVIVVSSFNLDITLNSFNTLTSTIYMVFQNNPSRLGGHFVNYSSTPGTRTLEVSFGGGCSDSVTYQRANLINIFGTSGGSETEKNGATVNFTPSGSASYVNNGCVAPVQPFTVETGQIPTSACPGATLNFIGSAQGQTSVSWSSYYGVFSDQNNLSTSYTIPASAMIGSTITITLTATNSCGAVITDQKNILISNTTLTLASDNSSQTICAGEAITPIRFTFGESATGATVTGLPTGVSSSIIGNELIINGTPSQDFTYEVSTSGGCETIILDGSITISPAATLTLNSANNNQTICSGNAISPIQYTFGGGATNLIVSTLPTGVSATLTGNTLTISGSATADFTYSITTSGGCNPITLDGGITVSPDATLVLDTANDSQTICSGNAIAPIQYTFGGGATGATVTGLPTGVTATTSGNTVTISGTAAGDFSYSITTVGGCGNVTLNGSITVSSNATLVLDSANNTQTVCSGNAIALIQYTFGGGATGATVTGLPTGVTATTSGNTVTISGTAAGDFSYSITTVGGCGSVTLNGSITVSSNATLVLDSANNTQTVCSGNAIASIQYTFGGGATGATVTGLPIGVTATTAGNTITISGTAAGDFSYSITTVSGCGSVTLNGSITVSSNATLVLDSANNTQTICSGNAIAPIQYTFGGGATSVNVTGLPTGVTATTSGNTVTISGTPATAFSYSITTVGGCGSVTLNGSITVSSNATLVLDSANNTQTICSGNAIAPIQYTFGGGATGATVTGLPTGVTATTSGNTVTISGTAAGDFSYSITTVGGCGSVTLNGSITVSSNATLVLDSANNTQTICSGNAIAPIQYTFGGGATSVNVTGLPTGVTATTSGNTVTISGTPATAFSYSITTVGGCGSVTLNGSININTGTTPTFNAVLPMCTGSTVSPLSNTSLEGIVGTWSPAFNNTATTIYTFTPNAGQCAVTTQMTVTIYPVPVVLPTSATSAFCSGGTTSISLSSNVPNATFSWTVTGANITGASGGSGNSINQTLNVTPNTTSTVALTYTIFAEANGCAGPATRVQIFVSPVPDVDIVHDNLPICSGTSTNISFTSSISGTQFNWIVLNAAGVTGATNGSGNEIIQTLTTTGLSSGSVTYQVTPVLNGCPGNPELVTVTVNPKPSIFTNSNQPVLCSNQSTAITVSTFEPNTVINWVVQPVGVDGAMDGTYTGTDLLIAQTLTTTGNAAGYVDYYITPSLSSCDGETIVVRINVNPIPEPVLTDGVICVDATGNPFQTFILDSGLSSATHDFVWYFNNNPIPNSNTATFTADEVGTYGVMATVRSTNCSSEIVIATITSSTPSDGITVEQSNYFSGNATLLVTVTGGTGVLEYQLDNGALQSSNVFTNVSSGLHTITAVDTQGCTYLTYEVYVIEYPQYFTPNGDGYNDTWFIAGLQATDKINIFDRYGKFIKQLQGEESWDGTYNQQQLPSTDYWFTVDYTENGNPKQFKAHFSLKR